MKRILILTMIMVFVLAGCGQNNFNTNESKDVEITNPALLEILQDEPENTEENVPNLEEQAITNGPTIINPLRSGIDINNMDDATLNGDFEFIDFDIKNKTLAVTFYEKDIYDAIDITTMEIGDSIIINDEIFLIESISEENEFIDINGGFTGSEFGMTFVPEVGGTYRTLLDDDYTTYSKLGKVTISIDDNFILNDYTRGEPEAESITCDFSGLEQFILELPEWDTGFGCHNTILRVVNNKIVEITRHWVP